MQDKAVGLAVGITMLALAQTAFASTGMAGLDTMFTTLDEGIGTSGYILFIVSVLGILGSIWSGHYFMAFGLFVATALAGAFVGHRAELGSTLSLSLGAELWVPWPLELLP